MFKFKKSFLIVTILLVCGVGFLVFSVNASEYEDSPENINVKKANKNLMVEWNDPNNGSAVGYNIYRSENEDQQGDLLHYFKDICSIYNGCWYIDEEVELNKEYFYIVKSVNFEGTESVNNDQYMGIVVLSESEKPDLAIKNILINGFEAGDKEYSLNQKVQLSIQYYNQGGDWSAKSKIGFYFDGNLLGMIDTHDMVGTLGVSSPHTSNEFETYLNKSGSHKIKAVIDDGDIIDEQDEYNNTLEKTITIINDAPTSAREIKIFDIKHYLENNALYIDWSANGMYGCHIQYSFNDSNIDEYRASVYSGPTEFNDSRYEYTFSYKGKISNFNAVTVNSNIIYYQVSCHNSLPEWGNSLTMSYAVDNEDDEDEENDTEEQGEENDEGDENIDDSNATTNHIILKLQRQITVLERQVLDLETRLTQLDQTFADRYAGTMFLDVENHGRLWYVDPESKNRFYFENGEAALSIGAKLATGITYEDLQRIPVGIADKLYNLKDTDGDGLPDRLESALGSDPNNADTDGDGYSDKDELLNGYNPTSNQKYSYLQSLIDRLEGKMLLQVSGPHSHGEIWYIHDGKRWYGGTQDSMYEIMKARSLGAVASDIRKIVVGEVEGIE